MSRLCFFSVLWGLLFVGCKSSILDDPTTIIRFQVAEPSHVKLTIENSYNTIVATLVDSNLQAGYHSAAWDAAGTPSGVYFYNLECTGTQSTYYFQETRHMLLIK